MKITYEYEGLIKAFEQPSAYSEKSLSVKDQLLKLLREQHKREGWELPDEVTLYLGHNDTTGIVGGLRFSRDGKDYCYGTRICRHLCGMDLREIEEAA